MEESNELDGILSAELALLDEAHHAQIAVKSAVERREWADFDRLNAEVAAAGQKIAVLEAQRLAIQSSALAAEELPQTRELKRQVKAAVHRLRWTQDALTRYIAEQRALTGAFIEAIYPEKRGALYSRYGTRASADMRSLVLNRAY